MPAKKETQVQSLGQEDPLEKEMATHSSKSQGQRSLAGYSPRGHNELDPTEWLDSKREEKCDNAWKIIQNTSRLPTRQIFRDSKCPFFPALSQRIILTFIFMFYWVEFLFHSCKCEESVLSHCAEQKLKLWTRVDNDSVPALLLKTIWTSVLFFFFTSTSLVLFFFFSSVRK